MSEPIDFEGAIADALGAANDADSHVELDPETFHPSQIARCQRRAYCSKLGLDDQSGLPGVFQTGTLIHEFLEEYLADRLSHAEFEREVTHRERGIMFTGRADCYDPDAGAVYDFKTRNGWYNFDPPTQRHLDQVYVYMAALGVERGQIVYLSKNDLEVRTYPEDGFFEFDAERFGTLVEKANRIQHVIETEGLPTGPEDIPFEPCDCFFCDNESLIDAEEFPGVDQEVPADADD
ncbi:hypothetical protein [Halobellus rubicundus]|uniref:PD-(D/E)XK endonuclease-like domain-containing protein n=1 Tax=Halobellus rubicundus TaxID=2996466 RepID=A0ABD5MFM2_9EURY